MSAKLLIILVGDCSYIGLAILSSLGKKDSEKKLINARSGNTTRNLRSTDGHISVVIFLDVAICK